jgi:(E)-4-hydroxy-3-methylbut-2-enyl-diphosphate synthase
MTNTDTRDVAATVNQIRRLADAGADIVRISCPDEAAAQAVGAIRADSPVPLIADIHFDYRLALIALAQGIDGLRINPGNIGAQERVRAVVDAARERRVPIRIGVNAGSLERRLLEQYGEPCPEAMVASALHHIRLLEEADYPEIKVSLKASDVPMTVAAYRLLSRQVDYPLHLGVTEAGGRRAGTVKSAIGLGMLLAEGIGDTLRVSLSTEPEEEVHVGFDILKALHLRSRGVDLIACPTCARQTFPVISVVEALEARLAHIREPVTLSIIGCVVNGPGEAKETMVGVVGGMGGHLLYHHGTPGEKVDETALIERVVAAVEAEAERMRAPSVREEQTG